MTGTACSWDKARSVFCGISRDGRLYIFFDEPFALQIGNGVRWWINGPELLGDGKDYIDGLPIIKYDR